MPPTPVGTMILTVCFGNPAPISAGLPCQPKRRGPRVPFLKSSPTLFTTAVCLVSMGCYGAYVARRNAHNAASRTIVATFKEIAMPYAPAQDATRLITRKPFIGTRRSLFVHDSRRNYAILGAAMRLLTSRAVDRSLPTLHRLFGAGYTTPSEVPAGTFNLLEFSRRCAVGA